MDSIRPENFGSARGCSMIDSIRFHVISCQNPCTKSRKLVFCIFLIALFCHINLFPETKIILYYVIHTIQTIRYVNLFFLDAQEIENNKSRRC